MVFVSVFILVWEFAHTLGLVGMMIHEWDEHVGFPGFGVVLLLIMYISYLAKSLANVHNDGQRLFFLCASLPPVVGTCFTTFH